MNLNDRRLPDSERHEIEKKMRLRDKENRLLGLVREIEDSKDAILVRRFFIVGLYSYLRERGIVDHNGEEVRRPTK